MLNKVLLSSSLILLCGALLLPGSILEDSSYGYCLPSPPEVAVWWCEATWKVGRKRALPQATNDAVKIEAARNEYEPFQLVLRPMVALSNVTVSVSDFVIPGGSPDAVIPATNVQVCVVEYVPVQFPTDVTCVPGNYPDPLVPLSEPIVADAGTNLPFWITVKVPKTVSAGQYLGMVTVQHASHSFTVPVRLRVFDFTLSDVTHTATAYGFEFDNLWHALTNRQQTNLVWDLYMQNFREHRISPYMPHGLAPIRWSLSPGGTFSHDFAAFDELMSRYLDEFDFTSFWVLKEPVRLGGYERFSPEYNQLFAKLLQPITTHLRERGWLNRAYAFWFDEPLPVHFPFVREGMQAHLEAAPELRRLLTAWPRPELYGFVDIWVTYLGISVFDASYSRWAERTAAGEEMWCYVAMHPRVNASNNFIDHPAITHRIRTWMMEKFGMVGELYWNVAFYRNRLTGTPRNPWLQTTSFDEYDKPEGNGDGVLVYPPTKDFPTTPVLSGPINSLRWELLREALEDREYFWLLKELIARAEERLGPAHPAVLEGYGARQTALASIRSPVEYDRNPLNLYTNRRRVAEAIEALNLGGPWFVRHPVSRAVSMGETLRLFAEALGWPVPTYQWQLNGTNLPGATNAILAVTNIGLSMLGEYTVVANNQHGKATSSVARICGRWLAAPQIVAHPKDTVRFEGGHAVLHVTAVSTNPCAYQWLKDGIALVWPCATNPVLLITNLSPADNGFYSAIVSNIGGVVTSAAARLLVLSPPHTNALLPAAPAWRYHDRGQDLGTNWVNLDYDDSSWPTGLGPLGYGTGRETTLICTGLMERPPTVYFRCSFHMPHLPQNAILLGRLRCDDGAVVYLNGSEIFRHNLPAGRIQFTTSAATPVEGAAQDAYTELIIPRGLFLPGTNLLAVELHQYTAGTTPVAFWPLDETVPPWRDQLGGYDFTGVGTNLVPMPGHVEGCVSNSASASSWLETPDCPALRYTGPFTVGGWFAFGFGGGADPASTCLEKTGEFRLYYTGTAVNRYRFRVGQTEVQDQTSIGIGRWHFVVGWYDGTNVYIQVDTNPVRSAAATPPTQTTNPVVSLKRGGTSGGFAADEVFLYKRVLTASERAALHTQGLRFVLTNTVEDMLFDFTLCVVTAQPPAFLEMPTNLVVFNGQTAAFRLSALSRIALTYQWLFNGVPITGATNPFFFLSGVNPAQAGLYVLVASNMGGAVTSPPVRLTVLAPPQIQISCPPTGKECILEFLGSCVVSELQTSTNLVDWTVVCTLPPSTNAICIVVPVSNEEQAAFYRVRLLPDADVSHVPFDPTKTAPLKLVPSLSPDGSKFVVQFTATNAPVCLQVSTNLVDWQPLYCLPRTSGIVSLVEHVPSKAACRFYRLLGGN